MGKQPLVEKHDSIERDKTTEDGARRSTGGAWNRMNGERFLKQIHCNNNNNNNTNKKGERKKTEAKLQLAQPTYFWAFGIWAFLMA